MLKRIITLIFIFALIITLGGEVILSALTVSAAESTNNYSGVLADLGKDTSFDKSSYPLVIGDKSLSLIQVAEGSQNELYIYVYQPGGTTDIVASSINISKEHKDLEFKNYTLTLVSQEGVYHKYLVNGFTVSSDEERYYEITSIYRTAMVGEDTTSDDNGNTITEVPYAVKRSFKLTDDSVYVEDIDVIAVTSKFVGFMRYPTRSFNWIEKDIDVHFVAFSTDKKIDKLLEADVYYTQQSYEDETRYLAGGNKVEPIYGDKEEKYAYLQFGNTITYENGGWFGKNYQWNVIESVDDFFASETVDRVIFESRVFDVSKSETKITEESKAFIQEQEWVLRFAYTDYYYNYTDSGNSQYSECSYTIVGDVSLLRLAFETDGVYYNLGVIDNKQSGDPIPDNDTSEGTKLELDDDFKLVLGVIALCFLGFLLLAIWDRVKPIFKFLLSLFTWPIRVIFGKRK